MTAPVCADCAELLAVCAEAANHLYSKQDMDRVREMARNALAPPTRRACAELAEALRRLRNEASGFLGMADRETHGITNMSCLQSRINAADEALAKHGGGK